MDQQTTLNGSAHPARDLKEHLLEMSRDAARIAELQSRFLLAEWRRARGRIRAAAALTAFALGIAAAALPVAIGGAGVLLAETTDLSLAGGLLCAAAGAVAIATICLVVAWLQVRKQAAAWQRSKTELYESAQSLRTAMSRAFARAEVGAYEP